MKINQGHSELLHALRRAVRGEVRFDPYSRILYSTDASAYHVEPVGVVIPHTMEDVHAAVETALRFSVPILARGGGSSLAGQAVGAALVIDFSKHLNRVLEINREEGWVRAEPGLVCDALQAAAHPHGLLYGCDPASSNRATVGGMVMNNSTGAHSVLYGMTADQVIDAQVILSDGTTTTFSPLNTSALSTKLETAGLEGEIYREVTRLVTHHDAAIRERYPRTWRRSSGYALNYLVPPHGFASTQPAGWEWATKFNARDVQNTAPYPAGGNFNLAKLLAGSEGTLAILTEAKLKLVRRPRMTALCVVHFDSVVASAEAAQAILETEPSAVELMDGTMLHLTRQVPTYARMLNFVQGKPGAILVVEYYGLSIADLTAKIERLEAQLQRRGLAQTFVRAMTPAEQANVWGVRKVGLGLLSSMRGDAKPIAFMEDVAVPVEKLGEYVRAVEHLLSEFDVHTAYYAHISAGCLHIRPMINLKDATGVAKKRAIGEAVLAETIRLGGAMSGEHGDGFSRSCWNERLFGSEIYGAFRDLKRAFDPEGLFNPGKIVDSPDVLENLRYGVGYKTTEVQTHLDFSLEGGFAHAVEQCNGAGICRQDGGVMCPSFQVTREEEHSTRGRANALRAALSGILPPSALTEKRMHQVLDLCLECKACKAECPSAVDMAKIKYEFLAHYQAEHGVPLRSLFFANIHRISRIMCHVPGVANWLLARPTVRWLNEQLLGISRHRILPEFAPQTFQKMAANGQSPAASRKPLAVLFMDTFTNYNHPEVGLAALKVLRAASFEAQVVEQQVCCGRPMISKGLLGQARDYARRNVIALAPYAEKGIPILGLEPSCLLTLRDEYLDLLPADPRAKLIAEHTFMLEEFLANETEHRPMQLPLRSADDDPPILVHGHCYQKALVGTAPLLAMLRLTGCQVSEIPSGCCGMAGSFGYEAEHFAISMQIGELRLFPAVRAADPDVSIVASGVSCRHQIEAGTGRKPKHPVEVLAERLAA